MRPIVRYLRQKSETYHMTIHVLMGIICAYATLSFFPQASIGFLIFFGVLGNLLPDIDHLAFVLFYGRHSEYSQIAKSFFKNKQFRNLFNFMKTNHKSNTGLYSHNVLSIILAGFAFWYFEAVKDRPSLTVFFMSWTTHYLFDISEDVLFFKSINPNWYLKFNKTPKKQLIPPPHPS